MNPDSVSAQVPDIADGVSESTKASTTEVQTITSRKKKKTNAQKCRDYRERKKLQNTMVQNIIAERSDQLPAKKPKTNAERRKKHYEAQKLKKQKSKKIPKTAKQRSKEYYYRKKKIQALNTLNHHSDAFPSNSEMKQKGIEAVGVNDIKTISTVCSDHFQEDSYHATGGYAQIRRLLSTAIPVLNKSTPILRETIKDPSSQHEVLDQEKSFTSQYKQHTEKNNPDTIPELHYNHNVEEQSKSPIPCKRIKRDDSHLVEKVKKVDIATDTSSTQINTEFDIFGRTVAMQLKSMPLQIAMEGQMFIQNYLSNLRLQQMDHGTCNYLHSSSPNSLCKSSPSRSPSPL